MNSPTVRYLEPQEIDSAVSELLRKYAKTRGKPVVPPIPVESIIEKHLKLTIQVKDLVKMLGHPDVLGATWFEQGIVRVDERITDQEGRYSFTLGHETGHWILHRPQVEAEKVAPTLFRNTEPPPAVVCRTSEKKAPAEWQADQFAARLLMPERFVRPAFAAAFGVEPVVIEGLASKRSDPSVYARWRDVAAAVIEKGNFTNVSNESMRYRLSDFGLVRDVAVDPRQRKLI